MRPTQTLRHHSSSSLLSRASRCRPRFWPPPLASRAATTPRCGRASQRLGRGMRPRSDSWNALPAWCKRAWSARAARCSTAGCVNLVCLLNSPAKQRQNLTSAFATLGASLMWCAPAADSWSSTAHHSWCATSRSSVRRGTIRQPPMLIPTLMPLRSSPSTRRRGWSSPSSLPRTLWKGASRPRVDRRVSRSLQNLVALMMSCRATLARQMDQQRQTKRRYARSVASPMSHSPGHANAWH